MEMWPGRSYPLGAQYDGSGVNFTLFSEVATRVELCLFDSAGNQHAVDLPERTGFVWHGYVPGIEPGQRYGYRVHGPGRPSRDIAAIRPSWCSTRTRRPSRVCRAGTRRSTPTRRARATWR